MEDIPSCFHNASSAESFRCPRQIEARLDRQIKALSQEQVARVSVNDPQICSNTNTLEEFRVFGDHQGEPLIRER